MEVVRQRRVHKRERASANIARSRGKCCTAARN